MSRSLNGLNANSALNLGLLKPYNLGDLANVNVARINLGFTGNIPDVYSSGSDSGVAGTLVAYNESGGIYAPILNTTEITCQSLVLTDLISDSITNTGEIVSAVVRSGSTYAVNAICTSVVSTTIESGNISNINTMR